MRPDSHDMILLGQKVVCVVGVARLCKGSSSCTIGFQLRYALLYDSQDELTAFVCSHCQFVMQQIAELFLCEVCMLHLV